MKMNIPKKDNEWSGMDYKCSVCGKDERLHWDKETNKRLFESKLCFTCDHWRGHFEADAFRDNAVVVNGVHYMIGRDEPASDGRWSGFGGSKFIVRFKKNGREVETRNLWCQGRISPDWLPKFPDNAEFVTP